MILSYYIIFYFVFEHNHFYMTKSITNIKCKKYIQDVYIEIIQYTQCVSMNNPKK